MSQPLHKPAMREASARHISVKALLRVQKLGFFAILEYAVAIHLQVRVPRSQVLLCCDLYIAVEVWEICIE